MVPPAATMANMAPVKTITCKCKKSRCLKLYCECFNKDEWCDQTCACINCANNPECAEERDKARAEIVGRNPEAFVKSTAPKSCNCKSSNCQKKYCICFAAGVACTYNCNCEGCMNQ